jgi:MHS family proline/betaine transporter-like MFS transporter
MTTISTRGNNSRHLLNIALFAGIFEWYEFSIYGFMSGILGPLFFSSSNPISAALSVYTVFAFSYFARPLGGLFFGRMGDTLSRGHALKLSLMTMAIPTALIGLLPTYAQAGYWATIALCLLRLIQGFGVGGEFPNSICYVFDEAPSRYKILLGSITCASTSVGMLLGSSVIAGLHSCFDIQTIHNGAWRIPFLLGIPLTACIAFMRRSIVESETFSAPLKTDKQSISFGIWERLYAERYNVLTVVLIGALLTTCSNLTLIWMPFYLTHFIHISSQLASLTNTLTLVFEIGVLAIAGYYIYFLPAERILKILHLSLLLLAYPLFQAISSGHILGIIIGQLTLAFFVGSINACFIAILGRLLPDDIRSLGASIVFAISPAFFGGIAPLLSTWLTHQTGLLAAPAFIIVGLALLTLPATLYLKSGHK